jgi:spore coat polysaccharide biosynthesis predicted glycosyltransferase SpsG
MKKLIVLTEGSPEIGLGHLVECKSLVDRWHHQHGLSSWFFLVEGENGAERFLNYRNVPHKLVPQGYLPTSAEAAEYDAILVNRKNVDFSFLQKLKNLGRKIAVIDELGHKRIAADILLNFSVNTSCHRYEFPDGKPLIFLGPEYFPASPELLDESELPKPVDSKTILVSMGGYDNSRITDKVIAVLKDYPQFSKEIILGPGFRRDNAFEGLVATLDNSFQFMSNVDDMPRRLRRSRLLVNSGGNTLYEAAILGTPALVIGEDPHEREQGALFMGLGTCHNIADGKDASINAIRDGFEKVLSLKIQKEKIIIKDWFEAFCG